jgi:hypothetical protein
MEGARREKRREGGRKGRRKKGRKESLTHAPYDLGASHFFPLFLSSYLFIGPPLISHTCLVSLV